MVFLCGTHVFFESIRPSGNTTTTTTMIFTCPVDNVDPDQVISRDFLGFASLPKRNWSILQEFLQLSLGPTEFWGRRSSSTTRRDAFFRLVWIQTRYPKAGQSVDRFSVSSKIPPGDFFPRCLLVSNCNLPQLSIRDTKTLSFPVE